MTRKTQIAGAAALAVVAIAAAIGIVAWRNRERWVIGDYGAVRGRGERIVSSLAHAAWTRLPTAIDIFEVDTGRHPAQLSDLLIDPGIPMWRGPYARTNNLIDMWGTPVRYSVGGETYRIHSAGRDKQFDTEDDVSI